MPETKRLFIAVEVPHNVRDDLKPALSQIQGVQWHPGKNFHITVKFIGDVPVESIDHLESLMNFVAGNFSPFTVNFRNLKVVESRLRLLVANPEVLDHMRRTFEHNLEKINLFHQDQIAFEPHITLGKVPRDFVPPHVDFDFNQINFHVAEIILFETVRGETAAEFVPIYKVNLIGK